MSIEIKLMQTTDQHNTDAKESIAKKMMIFGLARLNCYAGSSES